MFWWCFGWFGGGGGCGVVVWWWSDGEIGYACAWWCFGGVLVMVWWWSDGEIGYTCAWWCFGGGLMGRLDIHVPSNVMQIYVCLDINLIRSSLVIYKKRLPNAKKLASKGATFYWTYLITWDSMYSIGTTSKARISSTSASSTAAVQVMALAHTTTSKP